MSKLFLRLSQGAKPPRFYGFAWREFSSLRAVVILIPFNHIAAFIRHVYIRISVARQYNQKIHKLCEKAYECGLAKGRQTRTAAFQRGFTEGKRSEHKQILQQILHYTRGNVL